MKINQQQYAFFTYSDELADKCISNLQDEYPQYRQVTDPDIIRLKLSTLEYTFARTARRASQRPTLEPWVFDALFLMPTHEARVAFVTELYDEQHQMRETESNKRSSDVLKRPWL